MKRILILLLVLLLLPLIVKADDSVNEHRPPDEVLWPCTYIFWMTYEELEAAEIDDFGLVTLYDADIDVTYYAVEFDDGCESHSEIYSSTGSNGPDGDLYHYRAEDVTCDPCPWFIYDEYGNWYFVAYTPAQIDNDLVFTRLDTPDLGEYFVQDPEGGEIPGEVESYP